MIVPFCATGRFGDERKLRAIDGLGNLIGIFNNHKSVLFFERPSYHSEIWISSGHQYRTDIPELRRYAARIRSQTSCIDDYLSIPLLGVDCFTINHRSWWLIISSLPLALIYFGKDVWVAFEEVVKTTNDRIVLLECNIYPTEYLNDIISNFLYPCIFYRWPYAWSWYSPWKSLFEVETSRVLLENSLITDSGR